MKIIKKLLKYSVVGLVSIIVLIFVFGAVLYWSADMKQPDVKIDTTTYRVLDHGSYKQCDSSLLRLNSYGLWELYVEGDAIERGLSAGALMKDLLKYQETVFVDQIRQIIPSDGYLGFLRKMLIIFNRNLGEHVPQEYREEIYAISQYCSHDFDVIGTPYERQLNYHAAHDIGHTMQQYMLVGCSSFAAWGNESADSSLIVGRNFDFFVGEDFARNKVVMFYNPNKGYKFASVAWAGMTGVLSGMNETGLTVTINAATGSIPTSAATPISVLVREILQYASTIEEAYDIAKKYQTFVNESIMVSSAKDGYAVVIEKTTEKIDIYKSGKEYILCTNHYQSPLLVHEEYNVENIETTDSKYRYDRLKELVGENAPISPKGAASVLRNRFGKGGEDVGLGNEMTVNQSIAHHSVIFQPEKLLMWVSTKPWQSGEYICYDLNEVFAKKDFSEELNMSELTIACDSVFMQKDYHDIENFRKWTVKIRNATKEKPSMLSEKQIEEFVALNSRFFYTYKLVGDYFTSKGEGEEVKKYYKRALECKIPRTGERDEIEKLLKKTK